MTTQRQPMMAANWKLFKTAHEVTAFLKEFNPLITAIQSKSMPTVVLCGSFIFLPQLKQWQQEHRSPWIVGAQTMANQLEGAYTGEVSAKQLSSIGVDAVIIGHSERRQYYNETDITVNEKLKLALANGLIPIVCVGESLQEREQNKTDQVIERQVKAAIQGLSAIEVQHTVFAYEPIWAIGTGNTCDAAEANRVCSLIREIAGHQETRVLYGGSVKPDNIEGLMAQSDIDGGLVGGASLKPADFIPLVKAAFIPAGCC